MTAKRDDADRGDLVSRPDLTPTVSQVLRAVDEAAKSSYQKPAGGSDDHKLSVYWRVFGGAILSIAALVGLTVFNNYSASLSELRAELLKANETRAQAVNDLRAEIARQADARADLVRKSEFDARLTSQWTQVQALQTQNNGQNATLTSLKTEQDGLKERLTKYSTEADAVRKELAKVEALRERLTAAAADLTAVREATAKLREDVNQNKAADQERKDRRDLAQKMTDEALKELTKSAGDLREKLARVEALVNPPPTPVNPPPTPKK